MRSLNGNEVYGLLRKKLKATILNNARAHCHISVKTENVQTKTSHYHTEVMLFYFSEVARGTSKLNQT
jgi:hypothetical protein